MLLGLYARLTHLLLLVLELISCKIDTIYHAVLLKLVEVVIPKMTKASVP